MILPLCKVVPNLCHIFAIRFIGTGMQIKKALISDGIKISHFNYL